MIALRMGSDVVRDGGAMHRHLCRAAALMAALITLASVFSGCGPGAMDKGEAAPDKGKKSALAELVTGKEEPKLPPGAEDFVGREFAGIDLEVTASEASEVYLKPEGGGAGLRSAMVLKKAVFTVRTEGGHTTELEGENAVIDPFDKTVVFDRGATVNGPWDNILACDRLTWRYTKDALEADRGFTLKNGHGITNGVSCKTDIRFRQIRLE